MIHALCLYKIKELTHLFFVYIINCDFMIFLVQIWNEQAPYVGLWKNYLSLSKPKDTRNDVIASIDNITTVCFFIC